MENNFGLFFNFCIDLNIVVNLDFGRFSKDEGIVKERFLDILRGALDFLVGHEYERRMLKLQVKVQIL